MDGDHAAKSMEQGANSAMKDQEMTSGIHESVNQIVGPCRIPSACLKLTRISPGLAKRHKGPAHRCSPKTVHWARCSTVSRVASSIPLLRAVVATARIHLLTGFFLTADGVLGGTAQSIGGPFDKEGAIGKNFNADGKIGGMVQENLAEKKT